MTSWLEMRYCFCLNQYITVNSAPWPRISGSGDFVNRLKPSIEGFCLVQIRFFRMSVALSNIWKAFSRSLLISS